MSETNNVSNATSPVTPTPKDSERIAAQIAEIEKNPTASVDTGLQNQLSELKEKRAFFAFAESDGGFQLPENFKSLDAFWDSYRNLNRMATQKAQEAAELKRQLAGYDPRPQDSRMVTQDDPAHEAQSDNSGTIPDQPQGQPTNAQADIKTDGPLKIEAPKEAVETAATNPAPAIISDQEYSEIVAEVARSGQVSTEWVDKLTKRGLPKSVVQDFVVAQQAKAAQAWDTAIKVAGSKERLSEVFVWAGSNLPAAALEKVNAGLQDPTTNEMVLRGLISKWESSKPAAPQQATAPKTTKEPARIPSASLPQGRPADQYPPYRTMGELQKDQADPRYKTDASFRDAVSRRLLKSAFIQ